MILRLRARQERRCTFCCWPPGPLARRERRAYPVRYVRSEQHRLRAAARRGAAAGGHLLCCRSSTMHTGIACVAAPRICPPGARAKMHTLFPDGPLVSVVRKCAYVLSQATIMKILDAYGHG